MSKAKPPPEPHPTDDRFDDASYALVGRVVVAGFSVVVPALLDGYRAFRDRIRREQRERSVRARRQARAK